MSTGRNNKLAGQIGEFLVCAELGRRGLIATPFSGNVPAFDILAADDQCNTVPIQVKASRGDNWTSKADTWLKLTLDPETKAQINGGVQEIKNPELIYVHVAIARPDEGKDQYFILTKRQLQEVAIKGYSAWMDTIGWRRPRSPDSFDCRYWIEDLEQYRDNWKLITDQLCPSSTADEQTETAVDLSDGTTHQGYDEEYWTDKASWTLDAAKRLVEILNPVFPSAAISLKKERISVLLDGEPFIKVEKLGGNTSKLTFWFKDEVPSQAIEQLGKAELRSETRDFTKTGNGPNMQGLIVRVDVATMMNCSEVMLKLTELAKLSWNQ